MGSAVISQQQKKDAWQQKWPAPAKINLMLRITGRRDDGYHLLQTVFQMLDLCDWLTFHPLAEDQVTLQNPLPGVAEENDLTVRAAKLLKQVTGCRNGVRIDVEKHIPMGGGLGGGSSNAATTLVVLNHLWNLGMTRDDLMELGLRLGADVPVFVFGAAAWGEGVGEKLQELRLPEQWVLIIRPAVHVDTREIFTHPDLTRNSKPITIADFLKGERKNDCLGVVSGLYPPIAAAAEKLSTYAEAKLTGTGSCVFAEFATEQSARRVYTEFRDNWQVFLTKSLNKSPLFQKLNL